MIKLEKERKMALEVIMPKAGVDMTEGQIVQWNKKVGEFVKEGEMNLVREI